MALSGFTNIYRSKLRNDRVPDSEDSSDGLLLSVGRVSHDPEVWPSMIEGYVGRPGSGKTYTLTARVLQELKRKPDLLVFSSYEINDDRCTRIGLGDLLHCPPGLIVIDEAHLWFESRLSMKLPPSMLMRLSQTRKAGWNLLWSTQHESRVDKVLKNNSNWMWHCNAWGAWGGHPICFTAKCYEPEYFRKDKKHYTRRLRFFDRDVAAAYDTMEVLEVADHILDVKDVYRSSGEGRVPPRSVRVR